MATMPEGARWYGVQDGPDEWAYLNDVRYHAEVHLVGLVLAHLAYTARLSACMRARTLP